MCHNPINFYQNVHGKTFKCTIKRLITHFNYFQIYPTDQSVSSYSSNPSTPVSSPPPHGHHSFPGHPSEHRTVHMVCIYQRFVCLKLKA